MRPLARFSLIAALAAAVALACASRRSGEPFALLSLDEVQAMLGQPDVLVVDANTRKTFEKNHLPGARFLASREALPGIVPADRSTRLVFYCASPSWMASHEAAREAAKLGFEKVFVMPDGIFGWVKAGKPVEAGAG